MARKPKRIVEAAIVERIGAITAHDLLAMPGDSWGMIRDQITDRRHSKDGLVARCMACEGEVYIRAPKVRGSSSPHFAHYPGGASDCPWYHGRNIAPDDARAAQYRGRQESDFHRLMCQQVAELVALDERYIRHTVAEYLPPTENRHGRFPDVYVEWESFGSFAVEFQMSGTFQTEISARCKHYEREGIPLLWILFGIDTARMVPQSFRDVIRRHRGNAFVLDPAALIASREQKTLVLSCYLADGDRFDGPRLVRFDQLTIPRSKVPYHEDRIVTPRLCDIHQRRLPWFQTLAKWDRDKPLMGLERAQGLLVAAAFSIVATANGKKCNYASAHPNVRAMLNTFLNTGTFARYANLLTQLIGNTASCDLLRTTVGEHLQRHRNSMQADEESAEWQQLRRLLPEALDPVLRAELIYLDALPDWARPAGA
ncbi:hypothetical protein [Stappia sp. TSB10GB4]|uniref:competence protein CoiA family protein n=1 Tax=Stappia sp. TSB10GB4 TaxID=2003584 RepID=UPI00164575FE|nr:hypothetical protein [Stappia sp. TSB10GB4]